MIELARDVTSGVGGWDHGGNRVSGCPVAGRDGSPGDARVETGRRAPWMHPAPGRGGAHGSVAVGVLATARAVPAPDACFHQTGLGLVKHRAGTWTFRAGNVAPWSLTCGNRL
jgi:hypothetical protein